MKPHAPKQRLKIIVGNLLLFGSLVLLIQLNKTYFRPDTIPGSWQNIITGVFPNFIAALVLSLAIIRAVWQCKTQYHRQIVYGAALGIFGILCAKEYFYIWEASTHFDKGDIIASALGVLVSIAVYEGIRYGKPTAK